MSNEGKASIPPEGTGAEGLSSFAGAAAGAEPKFEKSSNSSRPDEEAAGGASGSGTPPPLANKSASSPMGTECSGSASVSSGTMAFSEYGKTYRELHVP